MQTMDGSRHGYGCKQSLGRVIDNVRALRWLSHGGQLRLADNITCQRPRGLGGADDSSADGVNGVNGVN